MEELEMVFEVLGVAVPLATLGVLAYLVKVVINGLVGFFNIDNSNIKRGLVVVIPVLVYAMWYFREVAFIQNFVIPVFLLIGFGAVASGFKYQENKGVEVVEIDAEDYDDPGVPSEKDLNVAPVIEAADIKKEGSE